jgi:hypothetical protein
MKRSTSAVGAGLLLAAAVGIGMVPNLSSAASLNLASQNLTPYRTCTITATPTGTTADVDATVRQASPNGNVGAANSVSVSSASGANQRIYIRFDLSLCSPAIPATAIVRLATLRLFMTAVPAACRTLDLYRVTASWTETGVTWNNQPFGTTINNPPTASRSGSFDVGTPAGCLNQSTGVYVTGANPTTDVASWVSGASTNLGWMIRDDTEGSVTTRTTTFSSKEAATVSQVPQLVITYVAVP